MAISYIGADVDHKMTELAIEQKNKIIARHRVRTTISDIKQVLNDISGKKILIFEESTLASWLYRNLLDTVDEIAVCDPRRNRVIYDDGDKSDPLDAAWLAALHRGGFTKLVHHTKDQQRQSLKESVALYQDSSKDTVRKINKFRAACRAHGLRVPRSVVHNADMRREWISNLPHTLAIQLSIMAEGLEVAIKQSKLAKELMIKRSKPYPMIRYWNQLPGMGPTRSVILFAYLDTPWRFSSPKKLWKYCGLGLKNTSSGTDKYGKPNTPKLCLYRKVNKRLKAVTLGAVLSAVRCGNNEFSDAYERMVHNGVTAANARHTIGRKLLSIMWGMWKSNTEYIPGLRNWSNDISDR
jgi:transposase